MKRYTAALLAAAVVLAGCGSDDESPSEAADTTTATTPEPEPETTTAPPTTEDVADGTVITTGESPFGEMLFDADDQAIYLFDLEKTSTPECYDDCAVAWPPVLTDGDPQADGAVEADLLGTTERSDGTTQVTYNDHPLYFYAHEAPGEVECHNVNLNGGLWYVVQPDGDPAPA